MAASDIPTVEQVRNLSDEQKETLNREIGRRIMKTIMIKAAVTTGMVVTAVLINKFLDSKTDDADETTNSDD